MKKIEYSVKVLLTGMLFLGVSNALKAQNVGINATGTVADASAALDVSSSDKGVLVPRVALTGTIDVTTINSPAVSLLVYNTATVSDVLPGYYYWNGTAWLAMVVANNNDNDSSNEYNTGASLSGTVLSVTDGGGSQTVDLSSLQDGIGTDSQVLSLSGNILSISGGNSVTLNDDVNDADSDPSNELQTITKSGNTVTLSHGGGTFTDSDNQLTEAQVDAYASNNGYLTSFTEVDGDASNELQMLSLSGSNITLSDGGGTVSINDGDSDPSNEYNTGVSLSGTTLSVTDGGGNQTVDLNGLQDNLGNHTATQDIDLSTSKLVGNGGSTGITIQNDGETRIENLPDYNPLTDNLYVVANSSGDLHKISLNDLASEINAINELIASYPSDAIFCPSGPTKIVDVTNPVTGKTWMDRNLGASRAATSSSDSLAFGDLYQWGRPADGHQCRQSDTTTTMSSTDVPGHNKFIVRTSTPFDWRATQNDNLWQGVNGVNNPCPTGYRVPTQAEYIAERSSWSNTLVTGAAAAPLKFPAAGRRTRIGSIFNAGTDGYYWTSTVRFHQSYRLSIHPVASGGFFWEDRANARSIRCIKD